MSWTWEYLHKCKVLKVCIRAADLVCIFLMTIDVEWAVLLTGFEFIFGETTKAIAHLESDWCFSVELYHFWSISTCYQVGFAYHFFHSSCWFILLIPSFFSSQHRAGIEPEALSVPGRHLSPLPHGVPPAVLASTSYIYRVFHLLPRMNEDNWICLFLSWDFRALIQGMLEKCDRFLWSQQA